MTNVIVVIGAGSIGQAIVRSVAAGKHVLLADIKTGERGCRSEGALRCRLQRTSAAVDVASRASVHALVETATSLGEVYGVMHATGVSPTQAPPETILRVDFYGTALVLEEFGRVIARGGSCIVIAS